MVPPEVLADYLLFKLNKLKNEEFVEAFGLREPTDDLYEVLPAVAEKAVARREDGGLDLDGAARYMLKAFRKGWLGKMMLDEFPDGWQPPANLRSSRSRLAASRAQQQGGQARGARKNGRQQGSSRDSRRGTGRRQGKSR